MKEQVRNLYNKAQENYPTLKAQVEAQVVRWFWADGGVGLFSLEPFYFEQHRFPKSRILKETPENTEDKYQYGVNANDEIIVERSYTEFKGQCYETFYFREDRQIISYHFDYSKEKNVSTQRYLSITMGYCRLFMLLLKAINGQRRLCSMKMINL